MSDPLAEVVALLQPSARFSKIVIGAGAWAVSRSDAGQPSYCAILDGGCRLVVDGHPAMALQAGDFVFVPAAYGVAMSSLVPPSSSTETQPLALGEGRFRVGPVDAPIDLGMVIGHCNFDSPDATLLVSLLPQIVHVHGEHRLATLVQMMGDESRQQRPARDEVLSRLLEVLLIEALRSSAGVEASPGLVRALADARLVMAIRAMHECPSRAWTVAELAQKAAMSRSSFFERFNHAVGIPPMEYLLAWRMALAKRMLRRGGASIAMIAERVGYSSANTFGVAFTRYTGVVPSRYAAEHKVQ